MLLLSPRHVLAMRLWCNHSHDRCRLQHGIRIASNLDPCFCFLSKSVKTCLHMCCCCCCPPYLQGRRLQDLPTKLNSPFLYMQWPVCPSAMSGKACAGLRSYVHSMRMSTAVPRAAKGGCARAAPVH